MGTKILIIQGHPDPDARHLGHALADSYKSGAVEAGHVGGAGVGDRLPDALHQAGAVQDLLCER